MNEPIVVHLSYPPRIRRHQFSPSSRHSALKNCNRGCCGLRNSPRFRKLDQVSGRNIRRTPINILSIDLHRRENDNNLLALRVPGLSSILECFRYRNRCRHRGRGQNPRARPTSSAGQVRSAGETRYLPCAYSRNIHRGFHGQWDEYDVGDITVRVGEVMRGGTAASNVPTGLVLVEVCPASPTPCPKLSPPHR